MAADRFSSKTKCAFAGVDPGGGFVFLTPAGTVTIDAIDKMGAAAQNIGTFNGQALLVGVVYLAILIAWPKVSSRIPASLVTAIGAGMVITVVLFMKMVSEETEVKGWKYYCDDDSQITHLRELPKSVRVYEINGPMFLGMADRISEIALKDFTKCLTIRMRGVPSLDATGMNALESLHQYCSESGVRLIFSHVNSQSMKTMERAGFVEPIGKEGFRSNIVDAIACATELVGNEN